MIKVVIVVGGGTYALGDNGIAEIKRVNNEIEFYDDGGNLIMSLFGGSYVLIY